MDDGTDEIPEIGRWTDFQRFCWCDQGGFHGGPEGGGDVGAGRGAAFLTLVFEGAADGVYRCVVWIRAPVDEVVILSPRLAHYSGVSSILAFGYVGGYFPVQAAEYARAACVVQAGEVVVVEDDGGHFCCVPREELDHVGWKAGFEEDAVDDVVGRYC